MRATPLIIALVLALIGLVWIGQGAGLIGGSFMTGDSFWGLVGALLLVAAAGLLLFERRRSRLR